MANGRGRPAEGNKHFVGRSEERSAFIEKYNRLREKVRAGSDEECARVISYCGSGGIGKTKLIEKHITDLREHGGSFCAYYSFESGTGKREVLESLRNILAESCGFDFAVFDTYLYLYAKGKGENPLPPFEEKKLLDNRIVSGIVTVANLFAAAAAFMGPAAAAAAAAAALIPPAADFFDETAGMIAEIKNKRKLQRYEKEVIYPCYLEMLPRAFAEDLKRNTEKAKEPVVIFLDTYEKLVNTDSGVGDPFSADIWLRDENGPISGARGVLWVISGRNRLEWKNDGKNSDKWDVILEQRELKCLGDTDSGAFLSDAGVSDNGLREELHRLTGGIPLYLDICADVYRDISRTREPVIGDFGNDRDKLAEIYVRDMDRSEKQMLHTIACLGVFDGDILEGVYREAGAGFDPFCLEDVKRHTYIRNIGGDNYVMHQVIAGVFKDKYGEETRLRVYRAAVRYFIKLAGESGVIAPEFVLSMRRLAEYGAELYGDSEFHDFYLDNIREGFYELCRRFKNDEAQSVINTVLEKFGENNGSLSGCAAMCDNSELMYWNIGSKEDYDRVTEYAHNAYEGYIRLLGSESIHTMFARAQEIFVREHPIEGYDDESSLMLFERVLEKSRERFADRLARAYTSLSLCRIEFIADPSGDIEDKLYEARLSRYGSEHSLTLKSQLRALCCADSSRTGELLDKLDGLYEKVVKRFGENNLFEPEILCAAGKAYLEQGAEHDPQKAYELFHKACDMYTLALGSEDDNTAEAFRGLASALDAMGRYDEALPVRKKVYDHYRMNSQVEEGDIYVWISARELAETAQNAGDTRTVEEMLAVLPDPADDVPEFDDEEFEEFEALEREYAEYYGKHIDVTEETPSEQEENNMAKLKYAPMGWNSWDCWGAAVNEETVRKNAEYMAANLKQYGWEYVVVDIQWYEPEAKSHEYRPFAELCVDEYSRVIPAQNRFPSSAGGKGFAPLAEYVHSLGLKFGIHIMRGIPRQAVHAGTKIKGTDRTARDIAKTGSICCWNTDMYGVDPAKEGAKEYYDSIFELYASWGVDFIKCDDICREMPHEETELIMLSQSLRSCGRDMVLSLSPGPALIEKAELYRQTSQMWRITDDFWDKWELLYDMFSRAEKWCIHTGGGCFPDADMLPVGKILQDYDKANRTKFTEDEQITMLTLWCIFRAPLMIGGDMAEGLDDFTLKLLTNVGVLDMHKNARHSHQVWRKHIDGNEYILWAAGAADGSGGYFALFNAGDLDGEIAIASDDLDLDCEICCTELWSGEKISLNGGKILLPKHGAKAFRY